MSVFIFSLFLLFSSCTMGNMISSVEEKAYQQIKSTTEGPMKNLQDSIQNIQSNISTKTEEVKEAVDKLQKAQNAAEEAFNAVKKLTE